MQSKLAGRTDILVTVLLVTTVCWWLNDGDRFEMLVVESLCWRLFSLCWWFSQCIKSVINISNLSQTHLVINIRQQHRCNLCEISLSLSLQWLIFTFCEGWSALFLHLSKWWWMRTGTNRLTVRYETEWNGWETGWVMGIKNNRFRTLTVALGTWASLLSQRRFDLLSALHSL